MKYVIILVVVIVLVRVDLLLKLFDRTMEKINRPEPVSLPAEIVPPSEVISLNDDKVIKLSPKDTFLVLLREFHATPNKELRERAMALLRAEPKMFGAGPDKDFEASLFRWRDLLVQDNPEIPLFLLELLKTLEGENREVVRKFFSLMMDINLELFIKFYSHSNDSNCSIATVIGDEIPEDEKINELREREDALLAYLKRKSLDPNLKSYATLCQYTVNLYLQDHPLRTIEPGEAE